MLNKNNKSDNSQSSALNMVGTGTLVKGDITSDGDLRVDGRIHGNVNSKSKIALGASAEIIGNAIARSADISGKIEGDLEIAETLFLRATAKITGNIKTSKIIIESGAVFNGNCYMNKQAAATPATPAG
jgi:cytoskeletal protein CcmA (bactofilin family)